jgi:GntR family histidine utilization transcriptional repressor
MNKSSKSLREPAMVKLPLHRQISQYIERSIAGGTLQPGDRVPSEHELVAQFGVARMTASRALSALAEQGLIVRNAGLGSFVTHPKPQSTLLRIPSIADEIRQRHHEYHYTMLSLGRTSAGMDVANALNLKLGESVFHSVCIHCEDNVPVQLEDRYVNPHVAPDFLAQDYTKQTPSSYLVDNVAFDEMEHVVDAVTPTPEQAAILKIEPTQPCLLLTRRTWTGKVPVTLVRCLHPGTRYRFGSRFAVENASSFA